MENNEKNKIDCFDESQEQETNVIEKDTISESERAELERLRIQEEKRKQKPFNIYDRVNISPNVLSGVIIFGIVVIVVAIAVGIITR